MRLQEETRLTTRPTGDGSGALHISSPTTEMCSDPTQGNEGNLNQGLHFSLRLFTSFSNSNPITSRKHNNQPLPLE